MSHGVMVRTFSAELRPTGEGRTVEGCVVPYGVPAKVSDAGAPPYLERFEPGSFRKQLRAAPRIGLRFEHGTGLAERIGRCRELSEESSGLYGSFDVTPGPFGDHALELVRQGVLGGFSVGFSDRFERWRREGDVVVRQSCHLHEVSLCEEPAHAGALVTALRSRADLASELGLPADAEADPLADRLRALGYLD
jgi:hypothetical protein